MCIHKCDNHCERVHENVKSSTRSFPGLFYSALMMNVLCAHNSCWMGTILSWVGTPAWSQLGHSCVACLFSQHVLIPGHYIYNTWLMWKGRFLFKSCPSLVHPTQKLRGTICFCVFSRGMWQSICNNLKWVQHIQDIFKPLSTLYVNPGFFNVFTSAYAWERPCLQHWPIASREKSIGRRSVLGQYIMAN